MRGGVAMGDTKATESLLEWPGVLLDRIAALLSKVGVDLAPLTLQLFLLAIVVALLVPTIKKLRARKKSDRAPLISVVALALVAAGVLIGLAENATTPRRVTGVLQSDRLENVRVALLDFREREISKDSGRVDTVSGRFALHYSPLVDGRARSLRVLAAGCKPQDFALARAALRAEAEITWGHRCVAG
jgi:hypothetical protein